MPMSIKPRYHRLHENGGLISYPKLFWCKNSVPRITASVQCTGYKALFIAKIFLNFMSYQIYSLYQHLRLPD
uniref:Uncharacterized protein n=1 Tax=mine drainage metagenome TaxID=410659 RepID=E6QSZ6_9ZZZZ